MSTASSVRALVLITGLFLLTTGCTVVGPEYKKPTADVADAWQEIETPTLDAAPPVDPEWWKSAFEDPVLDQLVETAMEQNLSLRSAALRVLQSRQQLAIAMGNRYPQQQDLAGEAQTNITNDGSAALYNLGFSMSWEGKRIGECE